MYLATQPNGTPDGQLIVVSADHGQFYPATDIAATFQEAIENWDDVAPKLADLFDQLQDGKIDGHPLDPQSLSAPLPRSWQWLDASAFFSHGELMQIAFGMDPLDTSRPLMYQGISDRFYSGYDDFPVPDEAMGIDFEGEFGVIVDHVPMGTSAEDALKHVKLIVQINDWSLRAIAPIEMKTGFGWVQAKPACSMAPFAVTPDALGDAWRSGRVCLNLDVELNGTKFGSPNGEHMGFGFHELIAHAAKTRDLVAGTIIGSGTVSNKNFREVGSACISERRGIEMVDEGEFKTSFMHFGDRVRMEAKTIDGKPLFGVIDQAVVKG